MEDHYSLPGLGLRILEALKSADKDVDALTPEDLAPVDEFHIRGRDSTLELARLAGLSEGLHVLDVGSGLGGSARFLASEYGCRVTGVDVTGEYCEVAGMLSARTGLSGKTEFRQGSAVDLPFEDGSFDVVWTEHVQMNVPDKAKMYTEAARVLKKTGKMVFHDIFLGQAGSPHFPVPWADEPSISHLVEPSEMKEILRSAGFEIGAWNDLTAQSLEWFRATIERFEKQGPPPLGLHVLMGEASKTRLANVLRNLEEDRVGIVQAMAGKPA